MNGDAQNMKNSKNKKNVKMFAQKPLFKNARNYGLKTITNALILKSKGVKIYIDLALDCYLF